jgi:hypothetical protein
MSCGFFRETSDVTTTRRLTPQLNLAGGPAGRRLSEAGSPSLMGTVLWLNTLFAVRPFIIDHFESFHGPDFAPIRFDSLTYFDSLSFTPSIL